MLRGHHSESREHGVVRAGLSHAALGAHQRPGGLATGRQDGTKKGHDQTVWPCGSWSDGTAGQKGRNSVSWWKKVLGLDVPWQTGQDAGAGGRCGVCMWLQWRVREDGSGGLN